MRRFAVQTRNDGYASLRDYQQTHVKIGQRFYGTDGLNKVQFFRNVGPDDLPNRFVGAGGFLAAERPTTVRLILVTDCEASRWDFQIGTNWTRVGFAVERSLDAGEQVALIIEWEGAEWIDVWGLDANTVVLPQNGPVIEDVSFFNSSHIVPEILYLDHDNAIEMDIDAHASTRFQMDAGNLIHVKKCSYCQRHLPLDPMVLGALSFHKHNAKKTFHQNECRACKKWRINDTFNPRRTPDQLHESSVITRERKILLREPEILQEIKQRTGAGLRSQVWNRFNRACFVCKAPVELNEFQLDHTRPLAYLWPIDEYATCLCAEHNNLKKDRFPIDFYTSRQLVELSHITGLSLQELSKKSINESELQRIINNIEVFAQEWDARTFFAIARKVRELLPQTDLLEFLRRANPVAYTRLISEYEDRP